eukprot:GHVP01022925.1.p1 GENE.GHVP01022925.1~~GHVP01022925.1.p1  ORF type:complete len:145 (-),score=19.93 GHVP01022925.1:56-490(-)
MKANLENEAITPDSAEAWNDAKGKPIANLALEKKLYLPIAELEMKAVWSAVARFGSILKARCQALTIHIDSLVVKRCLAGEASSMSITNLEYKRRIEGLLGSFHIRTFFRYINTSDNPADEFSRQFEIKNKVKGFRNVRTLMIV